MIRGNKPLPLVAWLAAFVLACGTPAPPAIPPSPAPVAPPVAAPPPAPTNAADTLVVAPRAFVPPLSPWLAHRRARGRVVEVLELESLGPAPDAPAIVAAIEARAGRGLRSVLLVGDAQREDEPLTNHLPTFYFDKLDYFSHHHQREHLFHRSLPRVDHDHQSFPSDLPFALPDDRGRAALEVGRLPARSAAEVTDYVAKVIRYETEPPRAWRRRVVVRAGPARFGRLLDTVIEQLALGILDEDVPYDLDVDLVFAKPGSPYSHRLDRLGTTLTEQANRGAFLLAYVGHSSPAYFDSVRYRGERYLLGSRHDFEAMRIEEGAPIFVSLSCDAGAFDMSKGRRSMAEEAVLNPRGAVGAFAASRESHPYPNLLYGEAMVDVLLGGPPATLGAAFRQVREEMQRRSSFLGERLSNLDTDSLKHEHVALYNLFGDPTLELRAPAKMTVRAPASVSPTAPLEVAFDRPTGGPTVVTVETRRRVVRGELRPTREIDALPLEEAFAAMADNHARAMDKVVARRDLPTGTTRVTLDAPTEPGDYVVKVWSSGEAAAWGHAFVAVTAP